MWVNPDPDPGGQGPNVKTPSPQELADLKDQNEQQLLLIAQLKEMLHKEQSSVTHEKVEEYVNSLSRAKAKRSRLKKDDSESSLTRTTSLANIDANKKERINLLRQQLEENKARLAERGKSQKGIEEMVTQLQAQLKDSPQFITSTPLNLSLSESKNLDYNENTSQKDLYNILLSKEKKVTELLNKSQKLEGTILDLQENLKEKDSVLDARTKAITLMTDNLSKKGKNTLDALEETKEQMRKMQENFITLEAGMKARQLTLLNDLKVKNFEISDLQQVNDQLRKEKFEIEKRISEFGNAGASGPSSDNIELERLRQELEKTKEDNRNLLLKISELENMEIPENSGYKELQNKFEETCQKNADYLSKISQLELQLVEVTSKLNSQGDNVTDSFTDLRKTSEEENIRLSDENSRNLSRISELQKQLEDLKLSKSTVMGSKTVQEENEEIAKLNKQLEESNKNMIKMRAQQKGKIKDLNKKLDQFKKMSDSNALILQLQNQVSKLNEKIAELEDEKGNLQLKMVESTGSSKGDSSEMDEQIKNLEENLSKATDELDEKNKVIGILESEVLLLKEDLKQKNEEISTQVSSEMSSIQYEEQIEKIEGEKKKLIEELCVVKAEKDELLEKIENLKKEKQELVTKLDSYIQENMDLIDKLEKLSAEKVSSAESIEIVEGLTQQEKLELAAYQKHINPEEPLKCSEDDNLEPPVELNESVLQLSEDTADLLQKIEMFTQERKEVMQKMEALKEENTSLNLKVREIENNRDVLEETYEQLQNEKEALINEKQELLEQLENVENDQKSAKEKGQSAEVLDAVLKELQIKFEALSQENDDLKRTLKDFDSKIQEKYDLENRLREVVKNNEYLESKLKANLEEINTYQLTIEENKNELISSSNIINQLHAKLEDREKDIQELNTNIKDLNNVISELQSKNSNYEMMESELQILKSALSEHIEQTKDYESEIAQNSETIKKLNEELVEMNRIIIESENKLEVKDSEIQKLTKDINNKEEFIKNLHSAIEEKDKKFRTVSEEIREKYLGLQKQLDTNGESLQKQIDELTGKNKEQLEKMKKIAANLKKKSQAYQDLETRYKSEKEKWENEDKEKKSSFLAYEERIAHLTREFKEIENQLRAKVEENRLMGEDIIRLHESIQSLEQKNVELQNYILELKHQEKLNEVSLQQEMSDSLHEEIDNNFPKSVPEEKIRELELLLETNESELNHYRERTEKFEEHIRKLEEEKTTLELQNSELLQKLDLTSSSFKEKSLLEDQLELKLAEVAANDEVLSKKLQESLKQHEELVKKNKEDEELIKKLKIKLKKAHDKVTELKAFQVNFQELETVNRELKNQVATLENNQRHIQSENESLHRRNMSDYEKIEADYQIQLEELLKAKNDLTVESEKLHEKVKELEDKEQELTIELDEYRLRLDQSENINLEEISRLNEELKVSKEKLEATLLENQNLNTELNDNNIKLENSLSEIENLNKQLEDVKEKLVTFGQLNKQLEISLDENQKLSIKLGESNEKLEHYVSEERHLKQQLNATSEKLHSSLQDVENLNSEVDGLKKVVQALEFAKSSLEASYDSAQKLSDASVMLPSNEIVLQEFSLENIKQNQHDVPTFAWAEQQFLIADNYKEVDEKHQDSLLETETLKHELNESNKRLQCSLQDAENLKMEIGMLKKEIEALQFAKSSLEASYESTQKIIESSATQPSTEMVYEKFAPKNIKIDRNEVPIFHWHDEQQQEQQQSKLFDSFAPLSNEQGQSFDHPNQQMIPQHNPPPSESLLQISIDQSVSQNPEHQPFSPVIEDGREALLKKIKTLEFLLYNVDKEKEIALEQCTQMVNELTEMIYEKVNPSHHRDGTLLSNLDSQIISEVEIEKVTSDKKALQQIEYASINKDCGIQPIPVNEEVIEPKRAYLCFDDDEIPQKKKASSDVESQVVSEIDVTDAASNKNELRKLEYEKVSKFFGPQKQPVIESLAQPKKAYLCYNKEDKPQSIEAFEENDDGWAWGPEEAKLEEDYISNVENTPQMKNLLLEIQQLKETVRVLQVERENYLEEIRQLQIKSGKLIKKCKDLKAKSGHDSSTKKHDEGAFFDLNETIQEELKSQVQQLEKKSKELETELAKERAERSGLLKRIDVLTSANERMMEMKEIQDTEVLRWQRKYQEIVEKLQEYEWRSDGFGEHKQEAREVSSSSASENNNKMQELENTIKDLTLDNEELQALLEEQTALRISAEKNKHVGSEEEIVSLKISNENLHKELNEVKAKYLEIQGELSAIQKQKEKLAGENSDLKKLLEVKEFKIKEVEKQFKMADETRDQLKSHDDLQSEVLTLRDQVDRQWALLQEKDIIINDLQSTLEQVNDRKVELEQSVRQLNTELNMKNKDIEILKSNTVENREESVQIAELRGTIDQMSLCIQGKEQAIHDLNLLLNELRKEKDIWENAEIQFKSSLAEKDEEINEVKAKNEKIDLENQQLLQELENKSMEIEKCQYLISDLQLRTRETDVIVAEKVKKDKENQKLQDDLQIKAQEIEEKQKLLEELQLQASKSVEAAVEKQTYLENLDIKLKEIEILNAEKLAKDNEIERLVQELHDKEQEFESRMSNLISELNENWRIQVDQRGADVAESWKMHLEMVEKDFAALQEKLKSDIVELEEKCNILMNENNELRKNVDQDIRNEVDKISSLQQQISNNQQIINSLNLALQEKDKQIEEIQNNLSNYLSLENELQILKAENAEKEKKLCEINIIIETTQKQFDEKREVVEAIVSVLEKNSASPISYEKQDILTEFQRQIGVIKERDEEILRLNQSIHETQSSSLKEKDKEILNLNETINDLNGKLTKILGEKDREIAGLTQVIEDLERELSVVHEKEAEIVRLISELEKTKEEKQNIEQDLKKIKQEHSNCQITVENYKKKVQEHYETQVSLQHNLEDRNRVINELNQQILQLQQSVRNDSNIELENLNSTILQIRQDYVTLQDTLGECQTQLYDSSQQLAQKTQELETVTHQLRYYQQNFSAYEEEINRLKTALDEREKEYNNSLESLKSKQFTDIQRHYEELLSNKEIDNQTLHAQIQEVLRANQEYNERLSQEFSSKQELEAKLSEQTQLVDEDTKQLEELKLIIEEQVARIEELKKELFDKSNQYDSLIAQMDLDRPPVTQQPSASTSANPVLSPHQSQYPEDNLSEPVSRAELDLALYMLHQRDVRCEELTVELTQLLEERDTLQLKLSNAIREKEDLRRKISDTADIPSPVIASDQGSTPSRSKSSAIFLAASGTELGKDPLEGDQNLASKLSELKNVGYKKDKTFVDEQEARRYQQFAIMQQHISEASKLPPEAAAKLVDASYTLSRDVQSPSKVLLNWLWGKNPPKADS